MRGSACSLAAFHQMLGVDVIERLDHRVPELLLHPPALRQSVLDAVDAAVTLARVVVAGVHDDQVVGRAIEQAGRQIGDVLLGDGHDDNIPAPRRFGDRDGSRAGLGGQAGE